MMPSRTILLPLYTLLLALPSALSCTTPGLSVCDTRNPADVTCIEATDGRYTYAANSAPIGRTVPDVTLADFEDTCYCHLVQNGLRGLVRLDSNYVATVCGGTAGDQLISGFQVWWDGKAAMLSAYDQARSLETYEYMLCLRETPVVPKATDFFVDVGWIEPAPEFEDQLPRGVSTDTATLCPGFAVDAYDMLYNPDVATLTGSVVACTCRETTLTYLGGTSSTSSNAFTFNTVCNQAKTVYWNGAGYRKTRYIEEVGSDGQSVTDACDVVVGSATTTLATIGRVSRMGALLRS